MTGFPFTRTACRLRRLRALRRLYPNTDSPDSGPSNIHSSSGTGNEHAGANVNPEAAYGNPQTDEHAKADINPKADEHPDAHSRAGSRRRPFQNRSYVPALKPGLSRESRRTGLPSWT